MIYLSFSDFIWCNKLQVHPCYCRWHYSLLYTYTTSSLAIPVNGHLDCFHVLAIVNNAAVKLGVHVSFRTMFFSGYMPRDGVTGSNVNSVLFYFIWGLSILFSIVAVPIYIFISCVGGFPFPTSSPAFIICRCKNPQQNTSKLNPAVHLKEHIPWSSGIYLRGCKGFSVSTNHSVWYTTPTNWRIKIIWSSQ